MRSSQRSRKRLRGIDCRKWASPRRVAEAWCPIWYSGTSRRPFAVVKSDRLEALKSSTEFASGKWGSDRTGSVTEKRVTAGGRPGVSRLVKEPGSQSSFAGRNGKPQVHLHKHKSSGRRFRRRKPGRSDRDHFQRSDRLQRTDTVRIRDSRSLWLPN